MTTFILSLVAVVLVLVIILQISKIMEFVDLLRGEEKAQEESHQTSGVLLFILFVIGFVAMIWSAVEYKDLFLKNPASEHGQWIDNMFDVTLVLTGIVFVLTQIALFYFAFKYRRSSKKKALYYPTNHKLEIWWTVIPSIVLTVLVLYGIYRWYNITSLPPKDAMVIEVTGRQFSWIVRYPGPDDAMGKKNFRNIDDINILGQLWEDGRNHDDILPAEMHLPVGRPVAVQINAQDVLHSFYLPHFRVKMDAVPGMPTSFWFTPTKTTKEMRELTGNENFNYELACAELCGAGHWSMKYRVVVETEEEYNEWLKNQKPYYEIVKAASGEEVPIGEGAPADTTANQVVSSL